MTVRDEIGLRVAALILVVLIGGFASPARAQEPPLPPADDRAQLSPREVQMMFDTYVAMQAQQVLGLRDDQYATFLTRLKALQDARRRHLQGRARILQELNRLTAPRAPRGDEAVIRERLKELQAHDERAAQEVRKAYEALDQVLDVHQQARLRVFEEQVERRKIEMLLRARQANRPRPQGRPNRPPPLD